MSVRFSLRGFLIVAPLIACLFAFSCTWLGSGGRGFFSPDTLQTRTQSEVLVPLTDLPVYRSAYTYRPQQYPLVDYLVEQGYWQQRSTPNPHWVLLFHWNKQWRDGDSQLKRVLRSGDSWIEWSEENPELARAVWPAYLTALRSDYLRSDAEYILFYGRQTSSVAELRQHLQGDPELSHLDAAFAHGSE